MTMGLKSGLVFSKCVGFRCLMLGLGFMVMSGQALAHIERLKNADLQPQLDKDKNRVMPHNKYLSYGVDTQLFSRVFQGNAGYYHGLIWVDNFFELRPTEKLFLNTRIVLYNPAASYGASASNFLHHFTNIRWVDNLQSYSEGNPNLSYQARFLDLGRQTFGAGLTLEEKEMNGIMLQLKKGVFDFKFIFAGTGGYNFFGDLYFLEIYFFEGLFGAHTFTTTTINDNHDRFYGIFNRRRFFESFTTLFEIGLRNRKAALLAGAMYEKKFFNDKVKVKGKYQFRWYQDGFAQNIERRINHDYLSVEQEDIPFTNSVNIFVVDDHVLVNSVIAEFSWMPLWWIHVYSNHEYVYLDYKNAARRGKYFTKSGLGFCPYRGREDCGYFIIANKATSAVAPITTADFDTSKTMFINTFYMGLEALFRF